MAEKGFPPEIAKAIEEAALERFGDIITAGVDRQLAERMPVIEAAVRANERARIRQMAVRNNAVCVGDEGTNCYFADLLGPEGQERSDEKRPGHG